MALITVFGGAGNIGRQIVKLLAGKGHIVRVASRHPEATLHLKTMGDIGQITPVQANVRNPDSVRAAVEGADAVINLVGILHQWGNQRFDTVQADGARNVASAAKDAGVASLVHFSAIGADAEFPSHYARTTAAGETAVREIFPEATILRPSVVFGPHDSFFNRFAALAQLPIPMAVFGCGRPRFTGSGFDIYGDGGTKFQPIYVGDVAAAAVACLEQSEPRGKTYELGGPRVYSFCELMRLVLRETGRQRPLLPLPFWYAGFIAGFIQLLPNPPLTRDQVRLLQRDNVVSGDIPGLAELGISATAAEVVMPTYLEVYRRGGSYAKVQPV